MNDPVAFLFVIVIILFIASAGFASVRKGGRG